MRPVKTQSDNIVEVILARAAVEPEHAAFVGRDGEITFGCLAAEVRRWASVIAGLPGLPDQGVPRIGVRCPGGVLHAVLMLAVMKAGGCAVPVAGELPGPERSTLAGATALHGILSWRAEDWTSDLLERRDLGGGVWWERLPPTRPCFPVEAFEKMQPAFVRFSSGTTGRSKGVVLSHRTLRARLDSANRRLRIGPSDCVLWTLPMAHHFAVSILLYLREGATVVLPEGSLAGDLLTAARDHGATVFYGSPFQAALLAAEPSGRQWPALRLAVSTAAPLGGEAAEAFRNRYGLRLVQGFGIIEAGLPMLNAAGENVLAVGIPDDFEVRLHGDGASGELCLRGPGMFDAYLVPWCPREEVMADGWFHTGDLATRESDGAIHLIGRMKSVINVGGSKCFPEEIEEVLRQHEGVAEARVYGEEHARWGMLPVAEIVAADPARPPMDAELTAHCRIRLAGYKLPVRYRLVRELARTASGKVRRG